MDAAMGKRAVCMYHPREPVSLRSHGAPFGDARFPCCGAVGFAQSKYASETGGKPSAWLDQPVTSATWGCRQAPSHLPFAPLLEQGGPLDPGRKGHDSESNRTGHGTWVLAQLVSASQLAAQSKRQGTATRSRSPISAAVSPSPKAAAPPSPTAELNGTRRASAGVSKQQCPPNNNAVRSGAVADVEALDRLVRV